MMREGGVGSEKLLLIGQRLVPDIYIESEIGKADKHMSEGAARVEGFIQDVIGRSIVEELVFPSFHALILGDKR
jgi:distribution and morphology protein 12